MGFNRSGNHEAMVNCGAYFASVDRHQRDASKWADDAFAVYEALAARPEIDTNRVSLYAVSAGTPAAYKLLQAHPKLWRGAILFSPTHFRIPSRIPGLRVFIDNGDADPSFGKQGMSVPMDFQDNAAKAGIPVTLLIHHGLGHIFRMPARGSECAEALIFLGRMRIMNSLGTTAMRIFTHSAAALLLAMASALFLINLTAPKDPVKPKAATAFGIGGYVRRKARNASHDPQVAIYAICGETNKNPFRKVTFRRKRDMMGAGNGKNARFLAVQRSRQLHPFPFSD